MMGYTSDYDNSVDTWNPESFVCIKCANYSGGCKCKRNVFIPYVHADMSKCTYYESGVKCQHCGRITKAGAE
jgi:hypothetical protein